MWNKTNNRIIKENILDTGERYEARGYELLIKLFSRLIRGLFTFKTRKGEILAASATFFLLISFCPLLLLLITIYAKCIGDVDLAHQHVMATLKNSIPHMAPWIMRSIEKILSNQLSNNNINWINLAIIAYACLGFSSSIIYGINSLSGTKSKGGFIVEELKSIMGGVLIGSFMLGLMVLNSYGVHNLQNSFMQGLLQYNILQSALSLIFFSLFYKYMTPIPIRGLDAILGATCFVALFLLGKSFYWIYLHYFQTDLANNFGNFYTLVIVFIWIYYLICSFYFAAGVVYAPLNFRRDDIYLSKPLEEEPEKKEEEQQEKKTKKEIKEEIKSKLKAAIKKKNPL